MDLKNLGHFFFSMHTFELICIKLNFFLALIYVIHEQEISFSRSESFLSAAKSYLLQMDERMCDTVEEVTAEWENTFLCIPQTEEMCSYLQNPIMFFPVSSFSLRSSWELLRGAEWTVIKDTCYIFSFFTIREELSKSALWNTWLWLASHDIAVKYYLLTIY